nr:MAG TPA: hypothetical protein [Caudoviricetes sp.]
MVFHRKYRGFVSLMGRGPSALSPPPMHRAPPLFFSGGKIWEGVFGLYRVLSFRAPFLRAG